MNRLQRAILIVALVNLVLVGLFPPYDYLPPVKGGIGAFDGFSFFLLDHPNSAINMSFLQLEIGVVVLNTAIAWLVAGRVRPAVAAGKRDWQKIVLIVTGINLALCLLFPPMQRTESVTRALLSSFDGFYFVLMPTPGRAIVTQLLWVELIFVLVNGALLYLLLKPGSAVEISDKARAAFAEELRRKRA